MTTLIAVGIILIALTSTRFENEILTVVIEEVQGKDVVHEELTSLKVSAPEQNFKPALTLDSLICWTPSQPEIKNKPGVPKLEAKVLLCKEPETDLIIIDVGSRHGVKTGYRFHIYRGDDYICDVIAKNVTSDFVGCYIDEVTKMNDELGMFKGVERYDNASTK